MIENSFLFLKMVYRDDGKKFNSLFGCLKRLTRTGGGVFSKKKGLEISGNPNTINQLDPS